MRSHPLYGALSQRGLVNRCRLANQYAAVLLTGPTVRLCRTIVTQVCQLASFLHCVFRHVGRRQRQLHV